MKVLIDGHMLGSNEGGNERYTKNLFDSLSKLKDKNFEIRLLVDRKFYKNSYYSRVKGVIVKSLNCNFQRLLFIIPESVMSEKADIVHSNYITPFLKNAKFVTTVHDISFKLFPRYFSLRERLIFNFLLPYSLALSDAIIVPSKFTEGEFLKYYPKYKKKVFYVHYAVDKVFRPILKTSAKSIIAKDFKLRPGFLLVLNGKNPRKNINNVIKGWIFSREKFPDLRLVIVGGTYNIDRKYLKLEGIAVLGNVKDEQLNALYNTARIFIYFSIYEGFGLPILEAASCGTPVICSDIKVHREIAGEGVLYADPFKSGDLARKIELILNDRKVAAKLRKSGNKLSKVYTWEKTAKQTVDIYSKILK